MTNNIPILEFDPDPNAVIEPSKAISSIDAPERCVVCFFREIIGLLKDEIQLDKVNELSGLLIDKGHPKILKELHSEMGSNPLYELDGYKHRIALYHPGVGAALAAGFLEEVIALGCRRFIAIGSCGVLDSNIAVGHLIVPTSAVRDEGVSYHYMPPSREVEASPIAVAAIEKALQRRNVPYLLSKTWTTDGVYRETPAKVKRRREEGCLTVEMEAAAFFAVAKFRNVEFAQILYGGDDVSGSEWDTRDWYKRKDVRKELFDIAVEACLEMD